MLKQISMPNGKGLELLPIDLIIYSLRNIKVPHLPCPSFQNSILHFHAYLQQSLGKNE